MKLRERQVVFVERCSAALKEHKNTLGVAPTGAGKTVMLAAIDGVDYPKPKTLVIQHRDELVSQNMTTYRLMVPDAGISLFNATEKNWDGDTTFAMIQTLSRKNNLATMPALDRIIIDEAHHIAADTYLRTIDHARKINPDVELLGVTATPVRGDRKAMLSVFDNVADQISLRELIASGHLVKPHAFVIDIGVQDKLRDVRKTASDYDMGEVASIMNSKVLNKRIYEEWYERCGQRQTVIFASTIQHCASVVETFREHGTRVEMVYFDMPAAQRKEVLAAYDRGEIQVLVNCFILTEGWDHQPTSCIVLLRPSSFKSTMIQMIGRGLRKVDPERYPGRIKDDCYVLDFGISILTHGDVDMQEDLEGKGTKICPECSSIVPVQVTECAICGYVWPKIEEEEEEEDGEVIGKPKKMLENFVLTEVDLFNDSPFKYEEMFDGLVLCASAFEAWAMVIWYGGRYVALGGTRAATGARSVAVLVESAERLQATASADDFLRVHGDTTMANKSKGWLRQPATEKQLSYIGLSPMQAIGMTRYAAACHLTWKFNETGIRHRLEEHAGERRIAA